MKLAQRWFCLFAVSAVAVFGQTRSIYEASPAAVPRLVNFSAKATDVQGKTLTGVVGATFAIYRDQTGGAPLWLETQNVTADAKGTLTAQLGATEPEGLPLDLFSSGDARWLGVTVNSGTEQPRILLMSVPYALKAADAQTLNGLPASAFALAAPATVGAGSAQAAAAPTPTEFASAPPPATSSVTTTGGTVNAIPLFTTATNVQNSILTQTGTTAVNVGGKLNLPATGAATATAGKTSRPENFVASTFNSTTATAVPQTFQLQAEPTGNNTASASGTLNLLYATGANTPAETGLKINSKGQITFAAGQTFPGSGVKSLALTAPASDFTVVGSPVTNTGTIGLNWTVAPDVNATANAIAKRDALGGFNVGWLSATMGTGANAITGADTFSGNTASGVLGTSVNGAGVSGSSPNATGVSGTGVVGISGLSTSQTGYGVVGTNGYGTGIYGSGFGTGIYGLAYQQNGYGVVGTDGSGIGVYGSGVIGVDAQSSSGGGEGLLAYDSSSGDGILAITSSGYAAWFSGDVHVEGTLSKAGGSFKIDHPLDPANKYLSHSFVESPDMKNIYDGVATLDASGQAVIQMPTWFSALNRDFRYQLTCIGGFAPIYIAEKLVSNRFKIAGGQPGMEVSWQVTGIRQDAWANAHRIPVEENKPEKERGSYLHPELFGAPEEQATVWRRHPETYRHLKEQPEKAKAAAATKP